MELHRLEELQLSISFKDEDLKSAQSAFCEIYQRYSRYLYTVLQNTLGDTCLDRDIMISISNDTFLKFYNDPLVFVIPDNAISDSCFRAWLAIVAKNRLKDLLLGNDDVKIISIDQSKDKNFFIDKEDEIEIESIELKILRGALQTFKEEHQCILRLYFTYYEEGKNLPSQILDMICNACGTTRENIRAVRKRGIGKIKKYFEESKKLQSIGYGKRN